MPARRFVLSWPALLITLAVIASCLWLALWQSQRGDEKAALAEQQLARQALPPQPLAEVLASTDPSGFPLLLHGNIDNQHTLLLDNRIVDGVAGYHVLSPLHTDDGHWLLVNRGWLPGGTDRRTLPEIPPLENPVTVAGVSYRYSDRVLTLAEDDLSAPSWPLRIQKVDIDALADLLGVDLAAVEIRVDPQALLESGDQLLRRWHDARLGPERHYAYAWQWLAIALAALAVFIAASMRPRPGDSEQ